MKLKIKILAILTLLCIFSTTSCDFVNTEFNKLSNNSTENGNMQHVGESEIKIEVSETEEIDVDTVSIYLSSVEEYNKFIETVDLPNDFITYDMLQDIGELNSFVVPDGDYLMYYGYHLLDENGFSIDVFITHLAQSEGGSLESTDTAKLQAKPISGFLNGQKFDQEKVFYNNIEYTYNSNGTLRYITTVVNNIKISVSPSSVYDSASGKVVALDFVDYKPVGENLITHLISGNEAEVDIARYLAERGK